MRIIIFFVMISTCSCHQIAYKKEVSGEKKVKKEFLDSNNAAVSEKSKSDETMTRYEEVLNIIYDYHKEQLKAYDDYDKAMNQSMNIAPEANSVLVELKALGSICNGPLTKEQVEQEIFGQSDSSVTNASDALDKRFFEQWKEFSSLYREGDEFYFYRSSPRSWMNLGGSEGYYLIRKNEYLGRFLTRIN